MEDKLTGLVERLKKAHGERLVSVTLYGSGASGEMHQKFSDLNVLCVLREVTPRELGESGPVFKWWREQGNPAPLLMTEREVRTSTDCFPIEFQDMKEQRRVLYGADVVADLEIDRSFYRAQVEHELRAKLLRLRQRAASALPDEKALLRLMLESLSTFCVLSRHAMLLSGIEAGGRKREVISKLGLVGADPAAFAALLSAREGGTDARGLAAAELFASYLQSIEAVVAHVDGLDK